MKQQITGQRKKLKCIIIDDQPIARKLLQDYVAGIDYLELRGQAENIVQAIPLLSNDNIDIIFLDIDMPKMKGIDLRASSGIRPGVIVTTVYPVYPVQAYGLEVLDCLVKPVRFERFLQACNKLKDPPAKNEVITASLPDHFVAKRDDEVYKVLYDDLLYAEALLDYVMLYTTTENLMIYTSINALEVQLPAREFMKVHKSFIVNIRKIRSIEGNILHIGKEKIAISEHLKQKLINQVF